MEKKSSFENEYVHVFIRDGILYSDFKDIPVMEIELTKFLVNERITLCNGMSYPTMFDIKKVKKWPQETRNFLAGEIGSKGINASALIVSSPVLKMMGNFFIAVNKPLVPTRLFTDKKSALNWLEQYKVISSRKETSTENESNS